MLLLNASNRIAAKRETGRWLASGCKLHDHLSEPSGIAQLLMIHGRSEGAHRSHGVRIVVDSHCGGAQRLGTEKIGAEISGLDDGGMSPERRKLDRQGFAK